MKKAPNTKRQRRVWICVVVFILAQVYFGSYLYLRSNHTFIHRAGYYLYDPRRDININTNHYIEPARVADGPKIFAMSALAMAIAREGDVEFDSSEFDQVLKEATSNIFEEERHRWRLFVFFKPAALLETLIWKVVQPDPPR